MYAMRLSADGPSPSVTPKAMHVSPFNPAPGDVAARGHRYRFGFEQTESRTTITVTLLATEQGKDQVNGNGGVKKENGREGVGDLDEGKDDTISTAVCRAVNKY